MAAIDADHPCPACGGAAERPSRIVGRDRLHDRHDVVEVAICAACGSGATQPPLGPDDLAALYPADYGPYADPGGRLARLASHVIRALQGRSALRRFPLADVVARPPGRGLDVGCGRGDLAALLVRHGWEMVGIEPSPAACDAARSRGVDARTGTLATAELEPRAYDLVVFQHSLEHTDDPHRDLSRVREALADGGMLVVTVPNFGCWQAHLFRDRWYHLDLPRHRTHFTGRGLARLLERAGLRLERIATSTSGVGLAATLQYALAGRCLFPGGMRLRVASGLALALLPLARLADRLGGGGDQLHVIASATSGDRSPRR